MSHTLSHYREQAAWALVPFFAEATKGDEYQAQGVALTVLEDYLPATPKEVQLAAQFIAYSFAALACLRAAKDLPTQEVIALHDAALRLHRSGQKVTTLLDAHRRKRRKAPCPLTPAQTAWDDATFRSALGAALDQMKQAEDKVPGLAAKRPAPRKPKLKIVAAEPMTARVLARIGGPSRSRAAGQTNRIILP